jgi:hypothetical protein
MLPDSTAGCRAAQPWGRGLVGVPQRMKPDPCPTVLHRRRFGHPGPSRAFLGQRFGHRSSPCEGWNQVTPAKPEPDLSPIAAARMDDLSLALLGSAGGLSGRCSLCANSYVLRPTWCAAWAAGANGVDVLRTALIGTTSTETPLLVPHPMAVPGPQPDVELN